MGKRGTPSKAHATGPIVHGSDDLVQSLSTADNGLMALARLLGHLAAREQLARISGPTNPCPHPPTPNQRDQEWRRP